MNILVTAGNTQSPIDKVRCITNIFTGRTGAAIAREAWRVGHRVHLLTSHPEVVAEHAVDDRWHVSPYRTFDDLAGLLETHVAAKPDAIIHSAAINDYQSAGIYGLAPGTRFDAPSGLWCGAPRLIDRVAGKVKSDEPELWLRLVRAPKLIDRFRDPWGFTGILVKFKLEVGKTDAELLAIAEASRVQSRAEFMVANTLEGAAEWAFVGPIAGRYDRIARPDLARRAIELLGSDR